MKKSKKITASGSKKIDPEVRKKRFFIVAAVFIIISIAFTVMLGVTQRKGPSITDEDRGLDVRTETVRGERGRIFDRNGVLIVGNSELYELVFEYGSMAYTSYEINNAILDCLKALHSSNSIEKRAEDYFPLEGTYPNMTFTKDAFDTETKVGYYYNRFLVKSQLSPDMSAEALVKRFTDKYKLTQTLFSKSEISELIRIHYDMERVGFGAYQSYTIAKNLDPSLESDLALITAIKEQRIEGATLIKQRERVYYYEDYAKHILGVLGKITAENVEKYEDYPLDALVGIGGVEETFEGYLRGVDGKRVTKYDAQGNLVSQYYDPAPVVGNDIYLTIDINLQIAAEDSLETEIEALESAEYGAATASDPNTGEVLVIASYPKYDIAPWNRALSGLYAPGSTYKVGAALAALEEGNINASTCYECNHAYQLGENPDKWPTCLGNHGSINVSEAIRVSCNVFFYELGHRYGIDSITPYTYRLGLGTPTGIEFDDKSGVVASEEYADSKGLEWNVFDDVTGPIGQSKHAYTPLQLSVYMSSIVNHGTRYSAHLLKSVKTRTGEVVLEKQPEVLDKVEFSDSTYKTLISAMHSVVDSSPTLSAYFSNVGVETGGKTGTAEKEGHVDNALFSGFAPLNDPSIVASCVIEEGEAGGNASKVVAAIFTEHFNPTPKEEDEDTEEAEE